MKRKQIIRGQAMVEYALLVTMVAISMIVIMGTVGNAAGTVWQAVIDSFETNPMFGVPTSVSSVTPDTTTPGTPTTEPTSTVTPGGPTITPTATLEFTLTPSLTFTEVPTEIPTATSTTVVDTPIPSATPNQKAVISARAERTDKAIRVYISVNQTISLSVKDTQSNVSINANCTSICNLKFDPLPGGGFIQITSPLGDDVILPYGPAY